MVISYYATNNNKKKVCIMFRLNPVLNENHYVVCVLENKEYHEYTYDVDEFDTAMGYYKSMVEEFEKGGGKK